MAKTTSPELNFPLEEITARINLIEQKIGFLIDETKKIQKNLYIATTLDDLVEKKQLDRAESKVYEILKEVILQNFPEDSISSEEEIKILGKNNFTWVLDPIDGSMNFLRRLPLYVISIGIQHRETSVAGIVIAPDFGDVYSAILGQGATKNHEEISVSQIHKLDRALLISAFPSNRKIILREILADLSAFLTSGRSIRRTGSIVLDLCWIAEGRIDGLWEKSVGIYDLSAATIILKEAGAIITDYSGSHTITYPSEIVVTNAYIHDQVLEVLKKSRTEISLN
jgi:myo-inositol-1(or 4)-monophosphatase